MSGNGWCTHPDRQVSSDVRILVRKAELACRNAWGSDLWVDASADESDDVVAAPRQTRPEQAAPVIHVTYDDEVTSVVSSGEHARSSAPLEDEVVEQSTISFVDDYDDEQDERRDLLYRDSRSAIERARQRHMQRRTQPVMPGEDVVISQGDEPNAADTTSRNQPVFEPDDFVEEEAPGPTLASDEHDDALLSEGIRTPTPRSLRLRRFRDEQPLPKKDLIATKIEPDIDGVDLELPASAAPERGRFDSIPEISADIDIPLLRRSSSANDHQRSAPRPETPDAGSYERALKRAHDINAAARIERDKERRWANAPAPLLETPRMPDLPDAPSNEPDHREPVGVILNPGTSATLHLRPAIDPARAPGMRVDAPQSRSTVSVPRPHGAPRQGRAPEARKSWWRGTRQAETVETPESTWSVSGGSDEWSSGNESVPEPTRLNLDHAEERSAAEREPLRQPIDVDAGEDMEAFRDRLFASGPVAEEPVVAQHRTPISVARRRPSATAPMPRRQAAPVLEPEPEPVYGAPNERPVKVRPHTEPAVLTRAQRHAEPAVPMQDDRYDTEHVPPVQARRREDRPQHVRELREQPPPMAQRLERVQPEALLEDPRDAWYEPEPVRDFDVRNLIEKDSGLLDMTIKIASDVPRACATCRNFRPSEQEGRGWCTNEWAFTHRQMVNETDLACDSTIGCWWLPADKVTWLEEFEIASDATPRVDRLLAHLNPERRAVGN